MRAIAALLVVSLVAACGGAREEEAVPAPPPVTVADFAGNWQVSSLLTGTMDPVASTMNGTADAASWTMSLEGRPIVALQVSISGDSLIAQSGEYESVLRKGVMVSLRTASVRQDGGLTGTVMATYRTPSGDEKVAGTFTAKRIM